MTVGTVRARRPHVESTPGALGGTFSLATGVMLDGAGQCGLRGAGRWLPRRQAGPVPNRSRR